MTWITLVAISGLAVAGHVSPFACNPAALGPAERHDHFEVVGPHLRGLVRHVEELPRGYAFGFAYDPRTARQLAHWAAEECACCPFFDIEVRMAHEGGPLELRLEGRDGTKAFIRQEFGEEWFRAHVAR